MERFSEMYFAASGAAEFFIGCHYFGRISAANSRIRPSAAIIIIVMAMQLCFGAVNSLIGIISSVFIGSDPDITAAAMILFNLLALFLSCVICELINKKLPILFPDAAEERSLAFPSSFYVPLAALLTAAVFIDHIFFGNTVSEEIFSGLPSKSVFSMIFYAAGIYAVFSVIHTHGEIIKSGMETGLAGLRAKNAESLFKSTRGFRHDVKKHMAVLAGFLEQNNVDGAKEYLSGMEADVRKLSYQFQTGRAAADIIINKGFSEAKEKGIDFVCKIMIPPCGISDPDLCVILGNAVENAIHACEAPECRKKFIEISGASWGDIFLIEIKNSYDGGKFKNGIGLKNIEATAKKYGGGLRISCSENVFTLQIILQNILRH
ncbi:MAG: sensor histidine kinase [Oscillospiraceae bacterium]|nr:sensor histidine kinase [Oscillospiraceae bacterium]